jgi:RHS repeat-associated protein
MAEQRSYTGSFTNRWKFTGKELDEETGLYYFGARFYNPVTSLWLSVDPLADVMPAWSPYSYCFNNPVRFIDQDGRIPILPLLAKAGANAAADWFMQTAMNYYFNPNTAGNWGASSSDVNGWQITRSGLEGLIPWRTPSGKMGRAAVSATGNVLANWAHQESNYSTEQAVQDFALGFVGDLGGGELGSLINKYGGKAIAKGFQRMGLDAPEQALRSIETGLLESSFSASRKMSFNSNQLKAKFKHASDFGVTGNYNPANAAKFQSAIKSFIGDANTSAFSGTYRNTIKGTHYYNSKTQNWIFKDSNGQFHTGWKLFPSQRQDLLINVNVR